MKSLRITFAVALLVTALGSLSALTAAAQGPIAYLDNQSHALAANSSQLLRFDYSLDNLNNVRPITTITLVNGTKSGVNFQVWSPETINDMANNKAIGMGTPQTVDCDTGELTGTGACQSADLIWSGAFGTSGTYFVNVINTNNAQANYMLKIQGSGVSLGQQVATAPNAQQPAAAPALNVNADDPAKATALDSAQHNIPAGGAAWYSFTYGLNDDKTRPQVTIRMPNGTNSGLTFQVWSPDTLSGGWFNNKPIGIGTAQTVDCNSGALTGSGECQSRDLIWVGTFGASGTYYVRVVNNNTAPANATLMMTVQ